MKKFSDLNVLPLDDESGLTGLKIKISSVLNRDVEVYDFRIKKSKYEKDAHGKCLHLQLKIDGAMRVLFSGSIYLMNVVQQLNKEADFPFTTRIVEVDLKHQFT